MMHFDTRAERRKTKTLENLQREERRFDTYAHAGVLQDTGAGGANPGRKSPGRKRVMSWGWRKDADQK